MSLSNILKPNIYNLYDNSLTFNEIAANPGGADTLWVNSADNDLYLGAQNISGNAGSVTSVTAGTGLSATPANPIVGAGTINIANTAVVAGAYTSANITVNAQGQITAAANGAASGVTSITAGSGITCAPNPIISTGTISLTAATLDRAVYQGANNMVISPGASAYFENYSTPVIASPNFNAVTGVYTSAVDGIYQIFFSCSVIPNAVGIITTLSINLSRGATITPIFNVAIPATTNSEITLAGSIITDLSIALGETCIVVADSVGVGSGGTVVLSQPFQIAIIQLA